MPPSFRETHSRDCRPHPAPARDRRSTRPPDTPSQSRLQCSSSFAAGSRSPAICSLMNSVVRLVLVERLDHIVAVLIKPAAQDSRHRRRSYPHSAPHPARYVPSARHRPSTPAAGPPHAHRPADSYPAHERRSSRRRRRQTRQVIRHAPQQRALVRIRANLQLFLFQASPARSGRCPSPPTSTCHRDHRNRRRTGRL
jgi:hypothetical protein